MDALYEFLLDFFPFTDEIHAENVVLSETLQREALGALLASADGTITLAPLERVRVLLALSHDLGYVDDDVHRYLSESLRRVADGHR